MSLNDPIADMLTRIRNAGSVKKAKVSIRASKACEGVAAVLKEEGFILDYDRIDDAKQGILRISLKYTPEGNSVIHAIDRVSTPGRRVYSNKDSLPRVMGGLGVSIVSTSKGIMSDRKCRAENVGGELICTVS